MLFEDILLTIFWIIVIFFPIIFSIFAIKKKYYSVLIGGGIGLLLGFLSSFFILGDNAFLHFLFVPLIHLCFGDCVGESCMGCMIAVPLWVTFFFIWLGIILGWIIGKIKSNKEM